MDKYGIIEIKQKKDIDEKENEKEDEKSEKETQRDEEEDPEDLYLENW